MSNYQNFREKLIPDRALKFKVFISLSLTILLLLFKTNVHSQCNTVQLFDLYQVPGFPQIDELVICGEPDTLALLIINNTGQPLTDVDILVNMSTGIQYAGSASVLDPNFPVSSINSSNVESPIFNFQTISADELQVLYFIVESNCRALNQPATAQYIFDYTIDYEYVNQNGASQTCSYNYIPIVDYSNTIKKPALNIINVTPRDVVIKDDTEECQTMSIFQSGINAYVDNFNFTMTGIDIAGSYNLTNFSIGGVQIPYNFNAVSETLSANIDASFLPNGILEEDEFVEIEICVQENLDCDTRSKNSIEYAVFYGCNNQVCGEPNIEETSVTYAPDFGADPIVTVNPVQYPEICGDNALFEVTLTSAQTDSIQGVFENLVLSFQICEADALEAVDVMINGVSLNPSDYYYNNFDFVVDFTNMTTDIDGLGVGLDDFDGDGFYDDLPGGEQLNLTIEVGIKCQDIDNINGCAALNCSFQQVTVTGDRHCGQPFQLLPVFSPPIDFFYGASQITTTETNVGTANVSIEGYNFGTGSGTNTTSVDIEFCYEFDSENITPCANSNTYFNLDISGYLPIVQDVAVDVNSGTWAGTSVPASNITQTYNANNTSTNIQIQAGNNNTGTLQCYTITLELDECLCYPVNYVVANASVIEECNDNGCSCTIVRACEEIFLASRRTCNCSCVVSDNIVELRRTTFGYTDQTMTTSLDETTAAVEDLNRYLPCDTAYVHVEYEVLDEFRFRDINRLLFRVQAHALSSWITNPALELYPNMTGAIIDEFSIEKVGNPGIHTSIEFNNLDCVSGSGAIVRPTENGLPTYYHGYYNGLVGDHVWSHYYDNQDNTFLDIDIFDEAHIANTSGDCLTEFFDMTDPKNGDKFHFIVRVPLQKNPYRHTVPAIDAMPIEPLSFRGYLLGQKTTNGINSSSFGSCGTKVPVETYCPDDIRVTTDIDVTECGATVEHTFILNNNTPPDWYKNEYRPYLYFDSLEMPVVSPLVYAGNAQVTTYNGSVYPVSDPTFGSGANCVAYNGTNYCVASGTSTQMQFDASQIPAIGVGMPDSPNDSIVLTYDLVRICPGSIENPASFELLYKYSYPCDFDGRGHLCGYTDGDPNRPGNYGFFYGTTTYPVSGCPGDGTNYGQPIFDDLPAHSFCDTSYTLNFNASGISLPLITASMNSNIIADLQNAPEPNSYTVCTGSGTGTHQNVITTITVPPPVLLLNVMDVNGVPMTFTQTSSDPLGTTYTVFFPDMPPDTCVTINIETELTFCPTGLDVETETCINTTSTCLDVELAAQLLAGGGDACSAASACFEYISEEAELQNEWIGTPFGEVEICTVQTYEVLIKNVREAILTGVGFNFILPPGMDYVPGSWQADYPSGENMWNTVSDPTPSGVNIFGDILTLTDNDVEAYLVANGLPGISSSLDSNQVSIRFDIIIGCDEFVSGSSIYFETKANDPCESTVSSGYAQSSPIVIENANPADYAQFTLIPGELDYPCDGEEIPLIVTGINLSQTNGESFMSQYCMIIPPEFTYTPGSFTFVNPSSYIPNNVTETDLGGGLIEICADVPDGLGPNEAFSVSTLVTPDPTAGCGEVLLSGQVTSLVEGMYCAITDDTCTVYVDNTVNSTIPYNMVPPFTMSDIEMSVECDDDPANTTYNFDLALLGVGQDFSGIISVEFYRDIDLNGQLDAYDPFLNSTTVNANIPSGSTVNETGSVTLPENVSCPVIVKLDFDSNCECSEIIFNYDEAPTPDFLADFDEPPLLCSGDSLNLTVCSGYGYTLSPSAGGTIVQNGADMSIILNPGYGVSSPVTLNVTSQQAGCSGSFYLEMYQVEELDFGYYGYQEVCNDLCSELYLGLPFQLSGQVAVSWSPTTYLDDPTSESPNICPTAVGQIDYAVSITLPNGCVQEDTVSVNVLPLANLEINGNQWLCPETSATLTATSGFDSYDWMLFDPASQTSTLITTTSTEQYIINAPGIYSVNAQYNVPTLCPGFSDTLEIYEAAVPVVNAGVDQVICIGDATQLDITTDRVVVNIVVSSGDINATPSCTDCINPEINPTENTCYLVTAESDFGCRSTDEICITVNPVPNPILDLTGEVEICASELPLTINVVESTTVSFDWYLDGALLSTGDSVNAMVSGCYSVVATNGFGCTAATADTVCVTVNINPEPELTALSDTTICEGDTVNLEATAGFDIYDFELIGTGSVQTGSNNIYTVSQTGDYTVTVTDANGCLGFTDTIFVILYPIPEPVIDLAGDTALCDYECTDLYVMGTYPTVIWYKGDVNNIANATQLGTTDTIEVCEAGTYFAYVVENDCEAVSSSIEITVYDPVEVEITASDLVVCADSLPITLTATSFVGATYEWSLAGASVQTGASNIYLANAIGSYTVEVTSSDGCVGTSELIGISTEPLPIVNAGIDQEICLGDMTQLDIATDGDIIGIEAINNCEDISQIAGHFYIYGTDTFVVDFPTGFVTYPYPGGTVYYDTDTSLYEVLLGLTGCNWDKPIPCDTLVYISTHATEDTYQIGNQNILIDETNNYVVYPYPGGTRYSIGSDGLDALLTKILDCDYGSLPSCTNCPNPEISPTENTCYLITAQSDFGCTSTDEVCITVNPVPNPVLDLGSNVEICSSELPLTITATDSTAISFDWYLDGVLIDTGNSLDAFVSGCYTVIATNAFGCTAENQKGLCVTVNTNPEPELTTLGDVSVCEGETVDLEATPGFDNYDFELIGAGAIQTGVNNLYTASQTGDYTVTVTDANACIGFTDTISIIINLIPEPEIEPIGNTELCDGECAEIYITENYQTVVWYQGDFNDIQNAIQIGTADTIQICQTGSYFAYVLENGCEGISSPIDITIYDPVEVEVTASDLIVCEDNLPVTLTATAYTGATYEWYLAGASVQTGSANTYEVNAAGTYTVEVISADGCVDESTPISILTEPLPSIDAGTDLTICEGDATELNIITDGSITAIVISFGDVNAIPSCIDCPNPTVNPIENTCYLITVESSFGCIATDEVCVEVNPLPNLVISLSGENMACEGELISIVASTTTAQNLSLSLNGVPLGSNLSIYNATQTGYYSVTAVNSFGCSIQSDSIYVEFYPNPEVTITLSGDGSFCVGGDLDLTATAGFVNYDFELIGQGSVYNGTNNVYTATQSGDYVVTVTDANGCSEISEAVSISIDPLPNPMVEADNGTILCNGDCTNLYVTGNYQSVVWYQGNPDDVINAIQMGSNNSMEICEAGNYFVYVQDENCEGTSEAIEVTIEAPYNVTILGENVVLCEGALPYNLTATVLSNATYNWYLNGNLIQANGQNTYSAISAGAYTVEVISPLGCSNNSAELLIETEPYPSIDAGNDLLICNDENTALNITTDGAITNIVVTSGDFTATPSCTDCNNPTVSPNRNTCYEITSESPIGCQSSDEVCVTVDEFYIPNLIVFGPNEACTSDAPIKLFVTGDNYTTFDWYLNGNPIVGSNNMFDAYTAGEYSVVVTNENGCIGTSATVEMNFWDNPIPELTVANNGLFCEGGNVEITATTGYDNYVFELVGYGIVANGSSNTFATTQEGDYLVTVTDDNGCSGTSNTISTEIDELETPEISGADGEILCEGECANLYITGNYESISWYADYDGNGNNLNSATFIGDGNTQEVCEEGDYFVIVENSLGCTIISENIFVEIEEGIDFNFNEEDYIVCEESLPYQLNAVDVVGATYNWYQGGVLVQSSTNSAFNAMESGAHIVEIVTSNGCAYTSSEAIIVVIPKPSLEIVGEDEICLGEETELFIQTDGSIVSINPISGDINASPSCTNCPNPMVDPSQTTTYEVLVTSGFNCTTTEQITVIVNDLPEPTISVDGELSACESNAPILINVDDVANYSNIDWYLNGITLVGSGNSFDAFVTGVYSVQVTDANGCSATSNEIEIAFYENPSVEISLNGTGTFCEGGDIDLTATAGFDNYVFELIGAGIVYSGTSNSYAANQSGDYQVTVIDSNSCEAVSATVSISVDPLPNPEIEGYTNETICNGGCTELYVIGNYQTINWYNGTSASDVNAINIGSGNTIQVCESGTYFVSVADGQSCEGTSLPIQISIDELVEIVLVESEIVVCEGELPVELEVNASVVGVYNWYQNGTLIQYGGSGMYTANSAGSYTVQLETVDGCLSEMMDITVIVNALPSLDAGNDVIACLGSSAQLNILTNGTITNINPVNGDLTATASCNDCADPTVSPNQTTTYEVTVESNEGCTITDQVVVEMVANENTATISSNDDLCASSCPTLYASPMSSEYNWYDENGNLVQSGSSSSFETCKEGAFMVVLIDENGCVSNPSDPITINPNPSVVLTIESGGALCEGGEILLTGTSGFDKYEWSYNFNIISNTTNNTLEVSNPGVYSVMATNENGCTANSNVVEISIDNISVPEITIEGNTELCEGEELQLCINENYDAYQWFETSNPSEIIGSGQCIVLSEMGTYAALINAGDCQAVSNEIDVVVDLNPIVELVVNTAFPACLGENVIITAITDVSNAVQWYFNGISIPNGTGDAFTTNQSGVYTVEVNNYNGCSTTSEVLVVIYAPSVPFELNIDGDGSFCEGLNAVLSVTPDVFAGYSFYNTNTNDLLQTGMSNSLAVTESGTYRVEVVDENGCTTLSDEIEVNVDENPSPQISTLNEEVVCFGECMDLTIIGNYTNIDWYLGDPNDMENASLVISNEEYTACESGSYFAYVSDDNDCEGFTDPIMVVIEPETIIEIEASDLTACENELPIVLAATGISGANYEWYNDGLMIQSGSDFTFNANESGSYKVVVTLQNGCSANSESVIIEINENPSVDLTFDGTLCEGGEITLIGTNGFDSYQWSHNGNNIATTSENTLLVTESGVYDLFVINANNCTASTSIEITAEGIPVPEIAINGDTELCEGEELELCIEGDFDTYQWFETSNSDETIGSDQCIILSATGIYAASAGIGECQALSNEVEITIAENLTVDLTSNVSIPTCEGEEIVLTATTDPSNTVQWYFNGSPILNEITDQITTNQAGTYTVEVSNENACNAISDELILAYHPEQAFELTIDGDGNFCKGLNATLTITPAVFEDYIFINVNTNTTVQSGANNSFEVTETGTYQVEVTDENGCVTLSDEIEINVDENPSPQIATLNDEVVCFGECMDLTIIGNYTNIDWYLGDPNDMVNASLLGSGDEYTACESGSYFAYVSDDNDCEGYSNLILVDIETETIVEITANDLQVCENELPIVLTAAEIAGAKYDWYHDGLMIQSGSDLTFNANEAGAYQLIVTSENGCSASSESVTIEIFKNSTVDLISEGTFCEGGEITLTGTDGFDSYQWIHNGNDIATTSNNTLVVTESGSYQLVATSENGCSATSESVTIEIFENPTVDLISEGTFCEGGEITLTGTNGFDSYEWIHNGNDIATTSNNTLVVTESGSYQLVATSENGCSASSESVIIEFNENPTVDLTFDGTLCEGGEITLTGTNGFDSYQWSHDGNDITTTSENTLLVTESGVYNLFVINANNCIASTSIEITAEGIPVPEITINGNTELCEGEELELCIEGDFDTYQWFETSNPSDIIGSNQCIILSATETYIASVSIGECQALSNEIEVTIAENLTVELNSNVSLPTCEGEEVVLTATTNPSNTIQWYFNGSPILDEKTDQITTNQAGVYTVEVSNENACNAISDELILEHYPEQAFELTIDGDGNFCEGLNATLTIAPAIFDDYIFINVNTNTTVQIGANNSFEVTETGTYQVEVTDENGCVTLSDEIEINVDENPSPQIVIIEDDFVCFGECKDLMILGDYTNIDWYLGYPDNLENASLVGSGDQYTACESGFYFAYVSDDNNCEGYSNSILIEIEPEVSVGINADNFASCKNELPIALTATGTSGANYEWYQNDLLVQSGVGDTFYANEAGAYELVVTTENGCSANSEPVIVEIYETPIVTLSTQDIVCEGALGTINATEGFANYDWYAADGTLLQSGINANYQTAVSGTYAVTATDVNGCLAEAQIGFQTIVCEEDVFDLALEKTLNQNQETLFMGGDEVSFQIEICNEGTIDGYNIVITDHLPAYTSLSENDTNGWIDNGDGTASTTYPGPLNVGECTAIEILIILDEDIPEGNHKNVAEIDDWEDEDGEKPEDTDSEGDNDDGDQSEDDEDNAVFLVEEEEIEEPQVADLSLEKVADATIYQNGDHVTYTLTITNDGPLDATNVVVEDLMPSEIVNPISTDPNFDSATLVWKIEQIEVGESISIEIIGIIDAGEGMILNYAQITDVDQEDPDSTPDNGTPQTNPEGWEDDESSATINVVAEQINCEELLVEVEASCLENKQYNVIISVLNLGNINSNYNIIDNNTGEIFADIENVSVLGPFESGTGFSYTIIDANNAECYRVVEKSSIDCIVTAIELLDFTGRAQEEGNLIWWSTATEKENDFFTLTRSTDGFNFEPINTVNAAGNSNQIITYDYLDVNAPLGLSYYQLLTTDKSGKVTISNIITLNRKRDVTNIEISPNPVTSNFNLALELNFESLVYVNLYDAKGSLMSKSIYEGQLGNNDFEVEANFLATGIYFVEVSIENQ